MVVVILLVGALAVVVVLSGEGGDDGTTAANGSDTADRSQTAEAEPPAEIRPVPEPTRASGSEEALNFYYARIAADCSGGPSGEAAVMAEISPTRFEIRGGGGERIIVDLEAQIITGTTGPEGRIPYIYQSCDPTVFVGTLPDEGGDPGPEAVWIVVLESLETSGYSRQEAVSRAASYGGLDAPVEVILSDEYESLNSGYWVIFAGEFDTEDGAAEYCRSIKDAVPPCYQRYVGRSG